LLGIHKQVRQAIGLTFRGYPFLVQRTAVGSRDFSLTGLAKLSEEFRERKHLILSWYLLKM